MDREIQDQLNTGTSVAQVPMDRLHPILESAFDGVWLVDVEGRTTYANKAMAALLGSTPDEMRGRRIMEFLDQAIWARVEGFLERQRTHSGERIEIRLRRADGTELVGLVAGIPIETHDGVYVGTMLDVSDVAGKRSHDVQVVENQRLEGIGLFAGGIVHDFNNLMTAIQGYAELARAALPEGDPVREDIEQVLASGARATAITRKLLAFTRRQIPVSVDVDPAQVISDLIPILRPLMGDDVEIVLEVDPDHGWIRVDPTGLEQVIVNLTVNARDAMLSGGTVTIAVHDVESTDLRLPDRGPGAISMVRMSVSDTGIGMDDATRARIFDPFYTTKSPGKGTGLGLSTAFGIVDQAGGHIQVETAPGQGSTFNVDLPRMEAAQAHGLRLVAPTLPRSCVVLLVDDDPAVREFARRSLVAAGYTVVAADGGEEALRASETWGDEIDVLITDIVMQGIHGPELAARIRAQRPNIGVVFMSGYAEGSAAGGGESRVSGEFLPKPFSGLALRHAIARAAEASRGRVALQQ